MQVEILLWNEKPIGVTPPTHVELKVIETEPGFKGDTSTNTLKAAKMNTGVTVMVPLFINEGDMLKIDTRTGEYVERIDGGNHLITFSGTNMTPPDRLGSGFTRYVLWVRTGSAPAAMEANVAYDPESRTGRATATTPHQRFTVMITAERATETSTPSDMVIFQQNVSP